MTLSQILFSGVAGLAVLAAGTLLFLPRDVTVVRTGLVPATPQAIVALAASNTGYQSFNPYMSSDPGLQIETLGPDSGVGSGFRFDMTEDDWAREKEVYGAYIGALQGAGVSCPPTGDNQPRPPRP